MTEFREDESLLLEVLGSSPELRIIDFFLDNKLFDFSKKEVIEALRMSKTTFYPKFKKIEKFGLVKVTRKFGKARLYALNKGNPIIKDLLLLEKALILKSSSDTIHNHLEKPLPA